ARRSGKPLSAVMLDADFFKKVNDSFGHQAGDEVLRMLARICGESLRESDVLGRYGGEEFAILFPETGVIKAKDVAERIRKAVAAEVVETEDGPVRITVSMGVASGMGKDVEIGAILERADAALYVAKENGRDRVEMDRDSFLDSRKEAQ
ncbi:MAG TPA: GGDEF domain-containing protein, partial [Rhodospirillales bacterium]|nr:GGDEF domain-containing protein [Rhodospirillales bacterium]